MLVRLPTMLAQIASATAEGSTMFEGFGAGYLSGHLRQVTYLVAMHLVHNCWGSRNVPWFPICTSIFSTDGSGLIKRLCLFVDLLEIQSSFQRIAFAAFIC